ncbi:MAG: lipid II flippase MurJ, partial [bacterium]
MKKSAGIISVVIGLVTGIQIVGQIVVARLFGARIELDAFVSAVTIPTMLTGVIAGTLNDAFLPILKKKLMLGEREGNKYFVKLLILLSLVVFVTSICLDLFSIPIIKQLFGTRGNAFIFLTDSLMKWMIYTMAFSLVGTLCSSYLYSKSKFIIPSLAYLIGSILNLAIIILLSPHYGIWSMVIAFIAAIIVQLFISFPYKVGGYFIDALPLLFTHESIAELIILLKAWVPLIISTLAVRFDNILIRSFSARLPVGYIVYTNLVAKLFAGLVGIMTIGIQTVFFPHLVELIHTHNLKKAKRQVNKAKLFGFLLTIGTVFVIVFIAPFFMRLLLTGGKFSGKNVETLISLFPYFIIPAVGWGISQIFFQPIIAIGKQHFLTVVNIGAVCLSWASAAYVYALFGGMAAISVGLIVLSFTGIIGAEIIWRIESKKLLLAHQ